MRPKLAEEKEGKGTVTDVNSKSEQLSVGDSDETLDNASNISSYLHKHKMVCVYVCVLDMAFASPVSMEMPLHVQGRKRDVRLTVTLS